MWNAIVKFFSDSETIFLARLQGLIGFLVAAAGAMDWSPLIGLASGGGFNRSQVISLGVVLLLQGIVTEWARRRRADDV